MLAQDALDRARATVARHAVAASDPTPLNVVSPDQESYVYRVALAPTGSMIAKVAAPGRLLAQFERLTAAHPKMQEGLYRVPRPIFYDPEEGVLLMEDAWGMSAETLWKNGPVGQSRSLAAAGGWLSRYHRRSAAQAPFNPDPHLNWLHKSIAAHQSGLRVIPRFDTLTQHLPELEQLAGPARQATTIRCITHRDFHLRNLLIRKHGRCYGVDMENAARDEAMRDLLFFLLHAATLLPDPIPVATLSGHARQLLRSYGREPAEPAARLFFQRCFALNHWATLDIGRAALSPRKARTLAAAETLLEAQDILALI